MGGISWNLDVPVVGSLIIYVLLGYLLSKEKLNLRQRCIIYFFGCAGLIFRYVYTYILSIQKESTDVSIKGYTMFHAVFLAVAVFELAKNVKWEKYLPDTIIEKLPKLSSCSFGIYLIHSIVMYYEQTIFHVSREGHIWRILLVPCTYCISLGIIFLLKKIPLIGKYICG